MIEHLKLPKEYDKIAVVKLGDKVYVNDAYSGSKNINDVVLVVF
jgi:N-methylhydantoinase B/oxoprolinase/acetone carboxylase alpha subunit